MRSKQVLIVDDDEINRELLTIMVQQEGLECHTAEDGAAALALMDTVDPDLILLDVMMPGLDGFEVTRRLKCNEATKNIPIILLTALSDRESRLKGLEAGAEEFLNKPVDRLELGIRMRNLLRLKEFQDFMLDHNRILAAEVRDRTAELCQTRLEIVHSLGRAAEYRDNETGKHIIRMSQFSQVMAAALGLDDELCELILHASPMHDIGKVGIPDSILLKPGKLTAEEWTIMQTHTTIGGEILMVNESSELLDMARQIALMHHEKWDGSGYPFGLSGEAIPIEARIVALADVFDALTSERPYKKAWSVEDAMAEIERQSGKHFEPRLVEVFKEVLPDVLVISNQYADAREQPAQSSIAI